MSWSVPLWTDVGQRVKQLVQCSAGSSASAVFLSLNTYMLKIKPRKIERDVGKKSIFKVIKQPFYNFKENANKPII